MTQKNNDQNKNVGKWLGLAVALMAAPELIIPAAVIWGIVTVIKKAASQSESAAFPKAITKPAQAKTQAITKPAQAKFDDCPKPLFCFHKDKGEHHVRRGKEIDPWDRPDIDIRKYQRQE